MKVLLTVSYDGTAYAGWQRQENAIAVQQRLEDALSTLLKRRIIVAGASRTDAGVHALGQRASFDARGLRVPLDKLPNVLNALLPPDIAVIHALEVPENFNPRFDAIQKTYAYSIYTRTNPLLARYNAFVPRPLNIKNMQEAAGHFVGVHDFAAFCATGSSAKTTTREVFMCQVENGQNDTVVITISGNAFLYNMVRIIAGTLVYVGIGKIAPTDIPQIIKSCNRKLAGKTMPPQGLLLKNIVYFLDKNQTLR